VSTELFPPGFPRRLSGGFTYNCPPLTACPLPPSFPVPRSPPPPPSRPFDWVQNCDVMFLGDFQQFGGNQAAAAALVHLLGGAVVEASYIPVPRRATVLVCTSPISASMLVGARQTPAGLIGSPVVAWQWLVECRRTGVRQPTEPYEARPPQAPIVHVDDDDEDGVGRKHRRRRGCLGC
jgi:hypothetical protein